MLKVCAVKHVGATMYKQLNIRCLHGRYYSIIILPVLDLGGSCDYVLNTKLLGSGNWELAWGDVHCSLVDKPVLQYCRLRSLYSGQHCS